MFRAAAVAACMAARPAICEWDTASTLEPPAPEGNAGVAVAIGDGWIAVGAPFATVETRNEQGCVHIYGRTENGTWSFTTTLVSAAGAAYAARYGENDAALKTRLETVRTAAEALTSGQELGLVRDRRLLTAGWESGEVDTLFAAIAAGARDDRSYPIRLLAD